ncbi:TetR/AcrR family transcriptional regulator [Clostridium sp. JN-9]|uniref:TetR/AcrR family transcriptional regulator n=1 Tax=Clostridium sp. JN-9 TaxID=2507159 RepID=UPI000FFE18B8|nr:TetR/AcrR family transcriptional regulator [Clostridium sp. JN-9]QAT39703.1 TetR/AcrR family transcriptional regulator [Clostridium sp. JN-9]
MPKETFLNLGEEKQENIMRAAISKFSSLGYEKSNMGDISKTAGVAKGSMYQYFENKKELFLYSIQWCIDLLMKKYNKFIISPDKNINIFDYLYDSSKEIIVQMREEREAVIFIQEVFLGRYKNIMDESMDYILKATDQYVLNFINQGKKNGYIREDIDDKLLCLYITGVSFKFKEYIINRAKSMGQEIIDEPFDEYEKEIKSMIELMKNGMGRS